MRFIDDNRNIKREDLVNCNLGDIYKPWYYHIYGEGNTKNNIDAALLVWKVSREIFYPEDLACTSFVYDYRKCPNDHLKDGILVNSIRNEGQKELIHVIKNQSCCCPVYLPFFDSPWSQMPRIYEGHHRALACERLNINIFANVWYTLNIKWPNPEWEALYSCIYTNDEWSNQIPIGTRKPWFKWKDWDDSLISDRPLFDTINQLKEIVQGNICKIIDVGCAEGLHLKWISESFNSTENIGIDQEGGRIIRGWLSLWARNLSNIKYIHSSWDNITDFLPADIVLLGSVLHHKGGLKLLEKCSKQSKYLIVEVSTRKNNEKINNSRTPTIELYLTKEENESIFRNFGLEWIQTANLENRYWYICWRKQ